MKTTKYYIVCPDLRYVEMSQNQYIIRIYSGYTESLPLAVRYQKIVQKLWNIYETDVISLEILEVWSSGSTELHTTVSKLLHTNFSECNMIRVMNLNDPRGYNHRTMTMTEDLYMMLQETFLSEYTPTDDTLPTMYKFSVFSRYMKSDVFKILAKRLITLYVPRLVLAWNCDVSDISEGVLERLELLPFDTFEDIINIAMIIYQLVYSQYDER